MKRRLLALLMALTMAVSLTIPSTFAYWDEDDNWIDEEEYWDTDDDGFYSDIGGIDIWGEEDPWGDDDWDYEPSSNDSSSYSYSSESYDSSSYSDNSESYVEDTPDYSRTSYMDGVEVDPDVALYVGETCTLTATPYGNCSASDPSYSWSSSNSSVASVSSSGRSVTVRANKAGTAAITCMATYNGASDTSTCYVTVYDNSSSSSSSSSSSTSEGWGDVITPLTYVTIDPDATISVGDTYPLHAYTDSPYLDNAINFSWRSSDSSVASVSSSGGYGVDYITVSGKKVGNATITCTATCQGVTKTAYCYVTVTGYGSYYYYYSGTLTDLSIDSNATIYTGNSYSLYANTYGSCYDSDVYFSWSSNNTSIASVASSGGYGVDSVRVYGNRAGTATITCKATHNGVTKTSTCYVTVKDYASSGSFYITSDLPTNYTSFNGIGEVITFGVKNTTGYSVSYQWYVDGSKNNSYSNGSSFNTKNLSTGTHNIYCVASTNKGNNSVTSRTCAITVKAISSTSTYSDATSTTGTMGNFRVQHDYGNQFIDVSSSDWYYSYVKTAYEYGLVNGKNSSDTYFPKDNFTVAEALKVAACVHSIYYKGTESTLTSATSSPWYNTYVNYCTSNGIINTGDFTNYNANCTRAQMAYIFSRCLPSSELVAVRNVNVPDCNNTSTQYYSNIQTLYNAGVVSGKEENNYYPTQPIVRSEVAKIVCNLVSPSMRDRNTF